MSSTEQRLPAAATWCSPPKSRWATTQGSVAAGGRGEGCRVDILEPLHTPLSETGPATLVPLREILTLTCVLKADISSSA